MARFLRTDTNSSGGHSRLNPPAVVGAGIAFHGPGVIRPRVTNRSIAPRVYTTSHLRPPPPGGPGIAFHGPGVRLTDPFSAEDLLRRRTRSRLRPPAIASVTFIASSIKVELQRIKPAAVVYRVGAPVVVSIGFVARQTKVELSRIRPPAVSYQVREPAVVSTTSIARPTKVELSRNRPSTVVYQVGAPIVVSSSSVFIASPIHTTLARIVRPVRTGSSVFKPAVIASAQGPQGGIGVQLAAQSRRQAKSHLSPAVVTPQATSYPTQIKVELAASRRGRAKSRLLRVPSAFQPVGSIRTELVRTPRKRGVANLEKPIVVGPILARPIRIELAPQRRGIPKSDLRLPAVVSPVLANPISTSLVRIRPLRTTTRLRRPVDLIDREDLGYINSHLTYSRRGKPKSSLRKPAVVAPVLARPIDVELAASFRGRPIARIEPPAVVAPVLARPIKTTLARIRPASVHAFLRPAAIGAVFARATHVTLATYQYRGIPKSSLPSVTYPGIVYPGIQSQRVRPRSTAPTVHSRLSPPTTTTPVVGQTFSASPAKLAPSPRGARAPHSLLRQVLYAPRVYEPIDGFLTPARDRTPPTHSKLSVPVVVGAGIAFRGPRVLRARVARIRYVAKSNLSEVVLYPSEIFVAPPIRVKTVRIVPARVRSQLLHVPEAFQPFAGVELRLARSARGKAKSFLGKPTDLVDRMDLGVVQISLAPSRRGIAKPRLLPPTVVAPVLARRTIVKTIRVRPAPVRSFLRKPVSVFLAVEIYGPEMVLAPSRRGKPKSKIFLPTDLVDRMDLGFVSVSLAPSKRGRPLSKLDPPTAVFPFLARKTVTALSRIRPVRTVAILHPPTDTTGLEDQGSVSVTSAYSLRGKAKSRLQPPAIAFPFLARATETTLARIRPVPTLWRLRRPVDLVDREDLGFVRTHLAYSLRGEAKPRLSAPVVVGPILARRILTVLAYQSRGKTTSQLFRPAVIGARPPVKGGTSITVVRQPYVTQYVTARLSSPTVVNPFRPIARPIDTTFAPQARGLEKSRIFPPVVVFPAVIAYPVSVTLAYSVRGKPISALGKPRLTEPIFAQGPTVQFASSFRGAAKSRLQPPTDVFPFFARAASTTLAQIIPVPVHSSLRRPTDLIDREDLGYIRTHLAPSSHGKPSSRLLPPAVVFPFSAPATHTTLVRIRPVATRSLLRLPVDTVGLEDQGRIRTTLTRIKPARTIARITPPVLYLPIARPTDLSLAYQSRRPGRWILRPMGSEAVVYAPLKVVLAPSTKLGRTPHSKLFAPAVVGDGIYFRGILAHNAYSRRGAPKSALRPPTTIEAELKAETVLATTLAYQTRGVPYSFLRAPLLVFTATPFLRPVSVHLAYSLRGTPKSHLFAPVDTVGLEDQGRIRISTVQIKPPRTLFRLAAPTVVGEVLAPPLVRKLARILPVKTQAVLKPPVFVIFIAAPIRIALARIRPVPVRSILGRPADLVDRMDLGYLRSHLAYSLRGKPRSHLSEPAVVGPVLSRPLEIVLTRIKPVPVHSALRPPVIPPLAPAEERFEVAVVLAKAYRPHIHSTLTRVVYEARSYRPITVTLAPAPKPTTISLLLPPEVVTPFFANPITVALAASTRGRPESSLKNPSVVGEPERYFGPEVELAYSRRGQPKSFLKPPAVVAQPIKFATPLMAWIVRIRPARTHWLYRGSFGRLLPGRGDICGIDYPGTEICGFDSGVDSRISGRDSAATEIRGVTDAGSTISGTDRPATNVTGTDRKRS